jgi:hypothetical protein
MIKKLKVLLKRMSYPFKNYCRSLPSIVEVPRAADRIISAAERADVIYKQDWMGRTQA